MRKKNNCFAVFSDCSPIFVVGAGRSGTTLLQLLLNAHPNIAIFGELQYFSQICQIKKDILSLYEAADINNFFNSLKKTAAYAFWPSDELLIEKTKNRLINTTRPSYENFFLFLMEEFAKSQTASRFGEKSPQNIRYLFELKHIFPNCKIIHIVRDPRDVVASCLRMDWTSNDIVINALKWKCDMLYAHEFKHNDNVILEIRYEDLLSSPQKTLKSICQFIGEEFDEKMLEFFKDAKKYIRDEPWKEGTFKPLNKNAVERWRRDLSGAQVFIIEKITGIFLAKYGYARAETSTSVKLAAPFVFCKEVLSYIAYKFNQKKGRKKDGDIIYGENTQLNKMLLKAIFK
jgi:hypothetical protein